MAELLRFGLIGCGAQGRYLSEALAMTERAELVACADPKAEAAEAAVQLCGYRQAYDDYWKMLEQEDLDAVIVATVHDQLFPAALAAVESGKHVFVEKPMALNAEDGRKLTKTAREARLKLMVGYTLRFMPERILLKRLLEQGAIGEVAHIGAGQLIGGMGGWLGEKAHGGGPLFYIGSHVIDNVLWVSGKRAKRVYAEVTWKDGSDVEAGVQLTIRFEDDSTAMICTSQRLGGRYGWLDVMGTGGRMRTEWEKTELWIQSNSIPEYQHLTSVNVPVMANLPPVPANAVARVSGSAYIRMWMGEFDDFTRAIIEDRDPAVTGEDGVRCLEVIDAVFKSAKAGMPVETAG